MVALAVFGAACTAKLSGTLADGPPRDRPGGDSPGTDPDDPGVEIPDGKVPEAPAMDGPTMGQPRVRRLTAEQYRNSLVDLFQDEAVPAADFLVDPPVFGFHVDARAAVVRDLDAQQLMTHAERVAEWAVTNKLNQVTPCQSDDSGCRLRFIETFGKRIFRGTITETQIDRYEALMETEEDFREGVASVLTAMIQSPHFLYRSEIGRREGSEIVLLPSEIATNLSYLLTNSTPDEELLRAAEQGRLASPEDLLREMNRLVDRDSAREVLGRFVEEWLEIDDLRERVKQNEDAANFRPEVRESMLGETRALFWELFYNEGTFEELLTANYTYLDQNLSQYYQLYGVGGNGFSRVDIEEGKRPFGILGHGSFLARHALAEQSSPVQRGYAIRKRLMCESIPPPPAGIDTMIRPPENTSTTREKYSEHSTNAYCAGCHQLMDPIGFTFENFDEFGRWRDQQNGHPIDTSGRITANPNMPEGEGVSVPGGQLGLSGYPDLIQFLNGSGQVEACFARFLTYYAFGIDGVGTRDVFDRAQLRGGTLKHYLEAIVTADHFSRRVPAGP